MSDRRSLFIFLLRLCLFVRQPLEHDEEYDDVSAFRLHLDMNRVLESFKSYAFFKHLTSHRAQMSSWPVTCCLRPWSTFLMLAQRLKCWKSGGRTNG